MDLLHCSNAEIWRLLLPSSLILFPKQTNSKELIFTYRNWVLFVNEDHSTFRIPKPPRIREMDYDECCHLLLSSDQVFDYDHAGIFELGEIMMDIGFLLPCFTKRRRDYRVEIVRSLSPEVPVRVVELPGVDLSFALYHGILACTRMYYETNKEEEYMVRRVQEIHHLRESAFS